MTRDEIRVLDMDQLEERAKAIAGEIENAEADALEILSEELTAIEERKGEIKAEAEETRAAMDAVIDGNGQEIETVKEERTMETIEKRNTPEYLDAWIANVKGTASVEQRALLTENATGGTIAVPVFVESEIQTAWENNEILQRVKKSYFKGNVRVGVEMSASGAVVHTEGGDPINPEELVLAYVSLIPQTIKKMVELSDETLDTDDSEVLARYIVDEITYQLAKKAAEDIVAMIMADANVSEVEAAGAAFATIDIITAEGNLAGDAEPVLITTRANAAALKAAVIGANYGYDPFDGLEVIYTSAAALGTDGYAIVADLSGIQCNFPNGYEPRIKVDETTNMDADMVRILGRLPVGMGIINYGKIVRIVDNK